MSKKRFNYRSFISIVCAVSFLVAAATGFIIFLTPYSKRMREAHIIFGFIFIAFAVVHLVFNFKPLSSYIVKKKPAGKNRELSFAVITLIILFLIYIGNMLPPFSTFLDFGESLQKRYQEENNSLTINTREDTSGIEMEIKVYKGESFKEVRRRPLANAVLTPQIAVWIETPEGAFIDTLYVTQASGKSSWFTMPFAKEPVKRAASLPVWSHKRGIESESEYLMPTENNPISDSVSSATPSGNFQLNTKIPADLERFHIFVELNRSWDYNEYYTPERTGEDVTLSHSRRSYSGQPAVVYSAEIIRGKGAEKTILTLAGHSDPAGKNGHIYEDISNLDTALTIVDLITVKL